MKPSDYAKQHEADFVAELMDFLRIPSVSTEERHRDDIRRAADFLKQRLEEAGFERVEVMPTGGHPVVYAEWMAAGEAAPTVLVYGHYDVQPPDPLELWETPPFEPTIRGEHLYARGVADDKGQLYIHVKAAESWRATVGHPPVHLKCLFEGEEEIGSVHLEPFIREHRDLLAADVAVISDSHILRPDLPAILYGLRGLAYVEITVSGPAHDLHSGSYGGAVHNPLHALAAMIAALHDEEGRITVPGFYDKVRPLTAEEREELARIPFDREAWLKETGVPTDWGDPAYTIIERTSARPTLDLNGMWGGYIGEGAKTIIPAKAHAKISMRLVPDQDPEEIGRLLVDYLKAIAPPTVRVEARILHGAPAALIERHSPAMEAAADAYEAGFGARPVFMREGGSIPVVTTFQEVLGLQPVLMGFGLPDDGIHAPNEKFYLPNFYRGIQTVIAFWEILAGR